MTPEEIVEVSRMKDLVLAVPGYDGAAGLIRADFVEEVQEKDHVEWLINQLGDALDFLDKLWVLLFIGLGECVDELEETFWDRQQLEQLDHLLDVLLEIRDNVVPPVDWVIVELDFVLRQGSRVLEADVRNHRA